MGKDKFKKRKERKRLIRAELLRKNIMVKEIAAGLGVTIQAVYKGMGAGSARVTEALIAAGVPKRLLKQIPPSPPLEKGGDCSSTQPKGGHTGPPLQQGEVDEDHRYEACASGGA
jgi:hypothetical protein